MVRRLLEMLRRRLSLILLAALALSVAIGSQIGMFQWDTEVYHVAGQAWREGKDPYELMLLTKTMGKQPLPFVYPPTVLPLAGAVSLLPLPVFHLGFLLAKLGALYLLFRCWRRIAGPETEISPGFALLAFHGALVLDLGSGNVAVFETLLLWLAFESWIEHRIGVFAAATLLAAQFKLLPAALLALGAWEQPERRRPILIGLVVAALLLGAAYAVAPEPWSRFLDLASAIDERGAQNPCMAAFWRDLTGTGIGSVGSGAGVVPHVLMSLVVLTITWRNIGAQALDQPVGRRRAVFLAVLAYALVAPRFKGYSYLLLVPAAATALEELKNYKVIYYIFLCFGLVPFLPSSVELPLGIGYLPALWAFAFWVILQRHPREEGMNTKMPVGASPR